MAAEAMRQRTTRFVQEWSVAVKNDTPSGPLAPAGRAPRVRFSIRGKLVGLVTLILVAALGTMVVLAAGYYKEDIEVRVQEQNLNLVRLVGSRVRRQLRRAVADIRTTDAGSLPALPASLVFAVRLESNRIEELGATSFLEENNIDRAKLMAALQQSAKRLAEASADVPVFVNVSPGFPTPIIAVSIKAGAADRFVVGILEPAAINENFGLTGAVQAFLVSMDGTVLADSDGKRVLAAAGLKGLAVHERMRESRLDNGQLRVEGAGGVPALASFQRLPEFSLAVVAQVPENLAFAALERMQRRNLFIMFVVLGTALLGVWYLARRLTTPLRRLAEATKRIEQGFYDVDLKATASDEVGVLTAAFTSMAHGLAERERVKEVLGKFIDHEIAARVLSGEIKPGGERRRCAILFCDLRNFTRMSHDREPEQIVEMLNEYFTEMVNWILLTRGVVDKFIGDAIMAHWGVLDDEGNHAERAVNAAVLMRKSLIEYNARNAGVRPPLHFGVGINIGPVIAGQIGSDRRLEYTVIGETVNLASRIEGMNKTFRTDILITEETFRDVGRAFNCMLMPPIRVKGDPRPLRVYAVLGRKDDSTCPRSIAELTALIMPEEATGQVNEDLELVMTQ